MRRAIKNILRVFKFIPFVNHFFFQWKLSRVPFPILWVNFLFQRIFRVNSKVNFPVHFTSRVIGFKNIKLHRDSNTVGSFCLSNNCYIQALQGIEIGANFLFAPGTTIITKNVKIAPKKHENHRKASCLKPPHSLFHRVRQHERSH